MTTITFKASDPEAKKLRDAAHKSRVSVSEFIRRKLFKGPKTGKITRVTCEHTGAPIFAPAPHLPPLTTETVREMLGDFP